MSFREDRTNEGDGGGGYYEGIFDTGSGINMDFQRMKRSMIHRKEVVNHTLSM
jgi:hypothetical protein